MDVASVGRSVREMDLGQLVTLAELGPGLRARIVEIRASSRVTRRCLALGLRVGAEVTVSRRRGRGVVAASGGNRVALGGDTAALVVVERVS